jgi:hypothetical protein
MTGKTNTPCCCQREVCTYDPDTGCGSRRMFGDSLGRTPGPAKSDAELSVGDVQREFYGWWVANQVDPAHGMITQNCALATWHGAYDWYVRNKSGAAQTRGHADAVTDIKELICDGFEEGMSLDDIANNILAALAPGNAQTADLETTHALHEFATDYRQQEQIIDALVETLEKIACRHVTESPLWWQLEARGALDCIAKDKDSDALAPGNAGAVDTEDYQKGWHVGYAEGFELGLRSHEPGNGAVEATMPNTECSCPYDGCDPCEYCHAPKSPAPEPAPDAVRALGRIHVYTIEDDDRIWLRADDSQAVSFQHNSPAAIALLKLAALVRAALTPDARSQK